jgi:hypothetical protein
MIAFGIRTWRDSRGAPPPSSDGDLITRSKIEASLQVDPLIPEIDSSRAGILKICVVTGNSRRCPGWSMPRN